MSRYNELLTVTLQTLGTSPKDHYEWRHLFSELIRQVAYLEYGSLKKVRSRVGWFVSMVKFLGLIRFNQDGTVDILPQMRQVIDRDLSLQLWRKWDITYRHNDRSHEFETGTAACFPKMKDFLHQLGLPVSDMEAVWNQNQMLSQVTTHDNEGNYPENTISQKDYEPRRISRSMLYRRYHRTSDSDFAKKYQREWRNQSWQILQLHDLYLRHFDEIYQLHADFKKQTGSNGAGPRAHSVLRKWFRDKLASMNQELPMLDDRLCAKESVTFKSWFYAVIGRKSITNYPKRKNKGSQLKPPAQFTVQDEIQAAVLERPVLAALNATRKPMGIPSIVGALLHDGIEVLASIHVEMALYSLVKQRVVHYDATEKKYETTDKTSDIDKETPPSPNATLAQAYATNSNAQQSNGNGYSLEKILKAKADSMDIIELHANSGKHPLFREEYRKRFLLTLLPQIEIMPLINLSEFQDLDPRVKETYNRRLKATSVNELLTILGVPK